MDRCLRRLHPDRLPLPLLRRPGPREELHRYLLLRLAPRARCELQPPPPQRRRIRGSGIPGISADQGGPRRHSFGRRELRASRAVRRHGARLPHRRGGAQERIYAHQFRRLPRNGGARVRGDTEEGGGGRRNLLVLRARCRPLEGGLRMQHGGSHRLEPALARPLEGGIERPPGRARRPLRT